MRYLELLAPAKNAEQGISAINHGADAVYIGAPLFGARAAAGNSLEDIESLVRYAHVFGCKVFVTLNTLLFDSELEAARSLIYQLYNIGVDALIIQDLGILEMDIPPIALHASTQTHNINLSRIQFLKKVGFQRVILARETSLEQMRTICKSVNVEIETFVQGALCVSYSGQCYLSQYLNERSGNRGCCGQPCRSSYDLYYQPSEGQELRLWMKNKHLLSLKDFNASQHIESMIDAGVCSFKIEGRLKDEAYVKNLTAYYRNLIDNIIEGKSRYQPVSDGKTTFFFTPDLARTFNRGFTDYCLSLSDKRDNGHQEGRQKMASFETQKSIGKMVGKVLMVDRGSIVVKTSETFSPGDGICYFTNDDARISKLEGFKVNRVEQNRLFLNRIPDSLTPGALLWRNLDFAFEKQLLGKTAERKIDCQLSFFETDKGFALEIDDQLGNKGNSEIVVEKNIARDPERAKDQIYTQLKKLGDTPFKAVEIRGIEEMENSYFIPTSQLNELRRNAVSELQENRIASNRPPDVTTVPNNEVYFENVVDYRANVVNQNSFQFYSRHGAIPKEYGSEKSKDYDGKQLMTTKYCLRYELGMCLMDSKTKEKGSLFLQNEKNLFRLCFDCSKCGMQLFAERKLKVKAK